LLTKALFTIKGTSNVLILYPTMHVAGVFNNFLLINVKKLLIISFSLSSDENEIVTTSSSLKPPQEITTILPYSE
jgi:hypothetical protein